MNSPRGVAAALSAVLVILAALHVRWALGGVTKGAAIPSRPDGTPIFRPGPLASLSIAAALTIAASLVLARADVIPLPLPGGLITVGTWGVAVAFAARAVGEFRYVGLFRRVRGTPFAKWDAWFFTPLCLALAIGVSFVAANAR